MRCDRNVGINYPNETYPNVTYLNETEHDRKVRVNYLRALEKSYKLYRPEGKRRLRLNLMTRRTNIWKI
jgi:hypothetical protein